MPRTISDETRQEIVRLGREGVGVTEIKRQTGAAVPTIAKFLERANVERRTYRIPDETRKLVIQLYGDGLGCTTIAREAGISRSAVLVILKNSDIARRPLPTPRGALKELPLGLIADRHLREGESLLDLAEEFGVSYAGLRERLERDGLIPPQRRKPFNAFEFIQTWQEAASVDEVAERLGLPNELVTARASRYRRQGVPLKRFKSGMAFDWDDLSEFAELFAADDEGKQVE